MPHRLILAHKAHQLAKGAHETAMGHIQDYVKQNHPDMADQLHENPTGHEPSPHGEDSMSVKHPEGSAAEEKSESPHEEEMEGDTPRHSMKQKRPAKYGGLY